LEDGRNVGENNCNYGDGTDQRVQNLIFMMIIIGIIKDNTEPLTIRL